MRLFSKFFLVRAADTVTVTLSDNTLTKTAIDPGDASVNMVFKTDGTTSTTGVQGSITPANWLNGSSLGSNYDIRVTPTSGTFTSGTTGAWLNLGTQRSWTVSQTVPDTKSCTATVEIRNASSLVVLDTATFTLSATVEF